MNTPRELVLAQLQTSVGREVRVSDWLEITQQRVDAFADAIDDHQWIHFDPARAAKDSPYGGTIARGGLQITEQYTAEIEGSSKPACVAEVIMHIYF